MSKKISLEQINKKNSESLFASQTDFSLFQYKNTRTKATYICKIHNHTYHMLPTNFWNGHGCPLCGKERRISNFPKSFTMKVRKSNSEIIEEFNKVHRQKYKYSQVVYTKNNIKVPIICIKENHGVFMQTPNKHLLGRGCPKCANENRNNNSKMSLAEFKKLGKKTHNNFYDYSLSSYKGALSYINIICPEHGLFKQKVSDHIRGHGCKLCAKEKNRIKLFKTTEDIILRAKEVHNNFYYYSQTKYTGVFNKIKIICPIHNAFYQVANTHLRGAGCPKCNKSKGEKTIAKILDRYKIKYKEQFKFQDCRYKLPLPFDFYLIDHDVCIEYHGAQHYKKVKYWGGPESLSYIQNNDNIKKKYCVKKKLKLIEIPYTVKMSEIELLLRKEIGF